MSAWGPSEADIMQDISLLFASFFFYSWDSFVLFFCRHGCCLGDDLRFRESSNPNPICKEFLIVRLCWNIVCVPGERVNFYFIAFFKAVVLTTPVLQLRFILNFLFSTFTLSCLSFSFAIFRLFHSFGFDIRRFPLCSCVLSWKI